MTPPNGQSPFARRLRWSGTCLISGLIIELGSLGWQHPLAFTLFLGPGILLSLTGAGLFLWGVLEQSQAGWSRFDDDR